MSEEFFSSNAPIAATLATLLRAPPSLAGCISIRMYTNTFPVLLLYYMSVSTHRYVFQYIRGLCKLVWMFIHFLITMFTACFMDIGGLICLVADMCSNVYP